MLSQANGKSNFSPISMFVNTLYQIKKVMEVSFYCLFTKRFFFLS